MAIVSLVLDAAFGDNPEGSIIQIDQEKAEALISAGIAHEATEDEVNGAADDGEEEAPMPEENAAPAPAMRSVDPHKAAYNAVVKGAEKAAAAILSKSNKKPTFSTPHVSGSDYDRTGGFKNLGDAVQNFILSRKGNTDARKKFGKWGDYQRTKATAMTISGGSGHQGGDLVPQAWADDVFKLAFDDVPNLIDMMTKIPMDSQVINLPSWQQLSRASGIQPAVTAEGAQIAATTGVTANVQMTLKKTAVLVNTTDELMRFNRYAVSELIKETAAYQIQYQVNDSIINGTNGGLNLVGNAATVTIVAESPGHISYNDVTKMYSALINTQGACWLTNMSTIPELLNTPYPNRTADVQFPAFPPGSFGVARLLDGDPATNLMGLPVYKLENVPGLGTRGALILWNPKLGCVAGTDGIVADYTNALYFDLAVDSFRFLYYFGSVNRLTGPYVRADGSKASNIVILSAGSTSAS